MNLQGDVSYHHRWSTCHETAAVSVTVHTCLLIIVCSSFGVHKHVMGIKYVDLASKEVTKKPTYTSNQLSLDTMCPKDRQLSSPYNGKKVPQSSHQLL